MINWRNINRRNALFNIKNKNNIIAFFLGYKTVKFKESSSQVIIWINVFDPKIKRSYEIYKLMLEKIIWITYRYNYNPIININPQIIFPERLTSYTSDAGWGCAIRYFIKRACQMAVANCILINSCNIKGILFNLILESERQNIIKLLFL